MKIDDTPSYHEPNIELIKNYDTNFPVLKSVTQVSEAKISSKHDIGWSVKVKKKKQVNILDQSLQSNLKGQKRKMKLKQSLQHIAKVINLAAIQKQGKNFQGQKTFKRNTQTKYMKTTTIDFLASL